MKLENQVCTFEQAKTLKNLGIIGDTVCYWKTNTTQTVVVNYIFRKWVEKFASFVGNRFYPAFNVAELGIMLCVNIKIDGAYYRFRANLEKTGAWHLKIRAMVQGKCLPLKQTQSKNEAEARADLLIFLIKKKYIQVPDCNSRLKDGIKLRQPIEKPMLK